MPDTPPPAGEDPLRGPEETLRDANLRVRNLEGSVGTGGIDESPDIYESATLGLVNIPEADKKRLKEVRREQARAEAAYDEIRPGRDLALWQKVRGGLLATTVGALLVGSIGYANFARSAGPTPAPTPTLESVLSDLKGAPAPVPTPTPTMVSMTDFPPPRLAIEKVLALFEQPKFTTSYAVKIENPDRAYLYFTWTGPNCGVWTPQVESASDDAVIQTAMVWNHPHPPCGVESDHRDVTVSLTVRYLTHSFIDGKTYSGVACSYVGSASGSGTPCTAVADVRRTPAP